MKKQFKKKSIASGFDKAAGTYDDAALLQGDIRKELLQRLEYFAINPKRVVDLGCGTGDALHFLKERYKQAEVLGLDISLQMLSCVVKKKRWFEPRKKIICGDMEKLPLATQSVDCVFSNMAMQWANDPVVMLQECKRIILPGGLLHISTLGPGTLMELRHCWQMEDEHLRVNDFLDVPSWGEMLLQVGFDDPVLDVDRITLKFSDGRAVMEYLKKIGAVNHRHDRQQGMMGKKLLNRVIENYESFRIDDYVPATFEVVYAHAWSVKKESGGTSGEFSICPSEIKRIRVDDD